METTKSERPRATQAAEAVYLENTLLRVFGVLFCHDPKRARLRTGNIEINRGVKERSIAVRFDPEYAQPGPFAHKVTLAIIRKQSLYGRPARKEISFSQRELMRLVGRRSWSGRYSEQLALALRQVRYTHVLAHFKRGDRFVERDFSIFNEVIIERRSSPRDPIVACTIVLADPIVQSLDDAHFTCLNHALLEQLGTIGQALYMRLFFHFSTQYDGHHRSRVLFRKRYSDICREWLGGLLVHAHRSKILDEQLGRHLDQLVSIGFLAGCDLSVAADGDGFVFSFRPGAKFFDDYQRFYNRRSVGQVRFDFREEREAIGEPHRVAYLFVEKRSGGVGSAAYVSSKDVETAKEFLKHLPLAAIGDFFDYALREARRTNFDVQTLGGLKQYLNDYLRSHKQREGAATRAQATRAAVDQQEADRKAYDRFYRTQIVQLFAGLPADERRTIEDLARLRTTAYSKSGKPGALTEPFFALNRDRITMQRHPGVVPSFEDWQAQRAR